MRRLLKIGPLIALASATISPLVAASLLPVEKVEESFRASGARKTLETYFDCGPSGQSTYSQVAKGEKRWIEVAAKLMPEAEGCQSTFLRDALARALSANPEAVLPLVGSTPGFSADRICIPFLSEDYPVKQHRTYLARLEARLKLIDGEKLQAAKEACLAEVKKAREYLK